MQLVFVCLLRNWLVWRPMCKMLRSSPGTQKQCDQNQDNSWDVFWRRDHLDDVWLDRERCNGNHVFLSPQSEAEGRGDVSRGSSQQPHSVDSQPGREEWRPPSGHSALSQEGIQLRPAKVSMSMTSCSPEHVLLWGEFAFVDVSVLGKLSVIVTEPFWCS